MMSFIKDSQLRHWVYLLGFISVTVWIFQDIMFPFAFGLFLAYLFKPFVDFLEKHKVKRHIASLFCMLVIVFINISAVFLIVPVIRKQVFSLIENVPDIIQFGKARANSLIEQLYTKIGSDQEIPDINSLLNGYQDEVLSTIADAVTSFVSGGSILFYIFSMLFVAPFLAFFIMNDWHKFTATMVGFFPKDERARAKDIGNKINSVFGGFLRGQVGVSLASMAYYGTMFSIFGMNYGFLIGVILGLLIFIPYVGLIMGIIITVVVASYQFSSLLVVLSFTIIYVVGQLLEDYVFIPNFIGRSVQIHPVSAIFAIMAGGSLIGVPGLIIGAPVAGIIAIFIREFYKNETQYTSNT